MRALQRARLAMRESNDLGKLLTAPYEERAVVVYAEDTFSHIQLKGYLEAMWHSHGIPYQYVTSDRDDPLLSQPPPGGTVWFIRDQLPRLMKSLECEVFITTMPDLGNFHVPRPKAGRTVYVFHSLNSTHTAYRSGAFDHYDHFLCTGPHHVAELRGLRTDSPKLSEVGYYKLDLIREEHESWLVDGVVERDLVLLAPSWGRQNLLEAHGVEVVNSLLSANLRVIVRPHPQFFHSLYPDGAEVIGRLQDEFSKHDSVEFELNIDSQWSFHRSALMISDWSGAAYEYALGTLRQVLFIDTPQKIFNDDWETVGLPPFERVMRQAVGEVVEVDAVASVGSRARRMLEMESVSYQLRDLSRELVFNPGKSATAGADAIAGEL